MATKLEKHERRKRWVIKDFKRIKKWQRELERKKDAINDNDTIAKVECRLEQIAIDEELARTKRIAKEVEDLSGEEWKLK